MFAVDSPRRTMDGRPARLTVALSLALLAVAGLLMVASGSHGLLPSPLTRPMSLLLVGVLLVLVELRSVSVPYRRQTYSFTLSGTPVVIGLLILPTAAVVGVFVASGGAVLLWQRRRSVKVLFNVALYAIEVAFEGWLLHAIVQQRPRMVFDTALAVLVVLCVGAALAGLLVAVVIRINGGQVAARTLVPSVTTAVLFQAFAAVAGLAAVLLLTAGPVGAAVFASMAAVAAAAYRGYTLLANRHEALAQVDRFVQWLPVTESTGDLAGQCLVRIRTLLNAGAAQLVMRDDDGRPQFVVTVDEADQVAVVLDRLQVGAAPHPQGVHQDVDDDAVDGGEWPAQPGFRLQPTVITAALAHGDRLQGSITVRDPLAERSAFAGSDSAVLRTLSGHVGMALRNSRMLAQLRRDATHDALTGLANRTVAHAAMDAVLDAPGGAPGLVVLLIDLDGFKEVNDALGHAVGDELLRRIGALLSMQSPAGSTVCRLGGDEFAVVLPDLGPAPQAAGEVLAARLAHAVSEPTQVEGAAVSVSASIGVAAWARGLTGGDLLRHADIAMYAAKTNGRRVHPYTEELDRGRIERLALLADLRRAVDRDEFVLEYQPQIDLASGLVASAEALVRWQHPRFGTLTPEEFIPLAESSGLIHPLTRLVLLQALRDCRTWTDSGLPMTVAVNLSARNLGDPGLIDLVHECLQESGVRPGSLVLEITESTVMADPDRTVHVLRRLVEEGVMFSLDDFGTGYSSLSYLQRLPVGEIKIDRTFVGGLDRPESRRASEALVRSITALGKEFGLHVVAEGVETTTALSRVRELGCDRVQGYLLGRPQGSAELLVTARRMRVSPDSRLGGPPGR